MQENSSPVTAWERRTFLRLAAAAGLSAPAGLALASCAAPAEPPADERASATTEPSPSDARDPANPFGVPEGSTVDAVIFDGGYGTDYVTFAAGVLEGVLAGRTVEVTPVTQVTAQVQPRLDGGTPPDLLDDSGPDAIGLATIVDGLEDLTDLVEAQNLEGLAISETLYPGVVEVGTYGGKLAALNYVLTVYALWYSASLFEANGWTPPTTWDEALELGAAARGQGRYLFTWGREAASYYLVLALDSAIKEGGDEVRLAVGNLAPDAWSLPPVQGVLAAMEQVVLRGYVHPGGAQTDYRTAQAQWSQAQEVLLYPCGSWIENEMKGQTALDFRMTGAPAPALGPGSALPYAAINNTPSEPYVVPSAAANPAGGKELLRVMLSQETATRFARTKLAPTVVRGTVPGDAFGSTALASQIDMLEAAGDQTFTHNVVSLYGMTAEVNALFTPFLSGQSGAASLASGLQALFDRVREDDAIPKVEVT